MHAFRYHSTPKTAKKLAKNNPSSLLGVVARKVSAIVRRRITLVQVSLFGAGVTTLTIYFAFVLCTKAENFNITYAHG